MADYEYIEQTGTVVPDTADILTGVENEYKAAFGADLVVTPDTPQGVLITAETIARDAVVRNNAALANQINPNLAGGVFLDAICALTGLQRIAATRSTVTATLTGVPGSIIPAGSRAQTAALDVFESTQQVVIGVGGSVDAPFQSVEYGPVAAAAGALNELVTPVLGWESVTNTNAAVLGTDEESDVSLRARRRVTLALQGVALPEAIISSLYDVEGVESLQFRENVANTTQVIDGISMVAHSIFACVDGGTDENVARAIFANKSLGCNYNGTTTVNVLDPVSGQTYPVKFQRPTNVEIEMNVSVSQGAFVGDVSTAVPEAVINFVNGTFNGFPGFAVGVPVSCFDLASAISAQCPGLLVRRVETRIAGSVDPYSTDDIAISLEEVARTFLSYVHVIVV